MSRTKTLAGLCHECGGPISFPAEMVGTVASCPRCGKQTELFLAPAPEDASLRRRGKVWAIIAAAILVVGVVGPIVGLNRFEKWAVVKRHQAAGLAAARAAEAAAQAGFGLSTITLAKTAGAVPMEALATITNTTDRRRLGVKVELDLLDASGRRVGRAMAHTEALDAGAQWALRAPVAEPKAVTARLASIKEGQ